MPSRTDRLDRLTAAQSSLSGDPAEQLPSPGPSRPPVTNVIRLGQQLAHAFGAARALIDRIPRDPDATIEELRRWYYHQHPAERDRLLWQRFTEAEQTHGRLEDAIRVSREALAVERLALGQAERERDTLAAHPLPRTVEEAATDPRAGAVGRYHSLGMEHQARQAAIADLERLLPPPEQTLNELTEAVVRLLEAVVTVDREAVVRRLRESGELEHLRARFERLWAMTNTYEADIDKWSRRAGRQLHVPRVIFPWPPPSVWEVLLDGPAQGPELQWEDDPGTPSA